MNDEDNSERDAPEVDSLLFKEVLGMFATGVTIVTTRDRDGHPHGLTANAFTSVSLDPPLVLVSVDKNSESHEHIGNSRFFCVNILGEGSEELSNRFAKHGIDKFEGVAHADRHTGAPVLDDAIAWIDCHLDEIHKGGDHTLFVGRVTGLHRKGGRPLLYFGGKYHRLPEAD